MTVRGLLLALALGAALACPTGAARAQVYGMCMASPCRLWFAPYGSVTTDSNGRWSVTIPASAGFTAAPNVQAMAVSADSTPANAADASLTAISAATGGGYTASGAVVLPATIQALGRLPVKAAGAGVVVNVVAVGP